MKKYHLVFISALLFICTDDGYSRDTNRTLDIIKQNYVWWDGMAKFYGEVISSTCSIMTEDAYQSLSFGEHSIHELMSNKAGIERGIGFRLQNCDWISSENRTFSGRRIHMIFDGVSDGEPDHFHLAGNVQGISLQILDSQGYSAKVGKSMPVQVVNKNTKEMRYTLRIIRNGMPLTPGSYHAVLRLRMVYE